MIKDLLSRLGGIENYGILSLLLFVFVFFGMVIWVFLLRKPHCNRMAQLPLEDEPETHSTESHRP